jgi:hypothetical protein
MTLLVLANRVSRFICISTSFIYAQRIGINTSLLEEKATAVDTLYQLCLALEEHFFPYLQDTAKLLIPLLKYPFHEYTRNVANHAMPCLLNCLKKAMQKQGSYCGLC